MSAEASNTDNKTSVSNNTKQNASTATGKSTNKNMNTNITNITDKTTTNADTTNIKGKVKLYAGIYFDNKRFGDNPIKNTMKSSFLM